ncbi:hypothetical protein B0H11DRAFT_599963 [Mycena galericulata]|nr:hypothetical protein B0H11DRAFT_599963 [Mycena galericulata]
MSVPVRHPWFDKPSMKRKHPSSPSDPSYRTPKRHRSGTLERGFASLTLDAPMVPAVQEPPPPPPPRPSTPVVPEITMKTSSWYEPERDRIVITDLDSYSDDEADASADTDTPTDAPVISPALIRRIASLTPRTLPVPPPQSQALVVFRPLASQIPPPEPKPDEDAMDVEP